MSDVNRPIIQISTGVQPPLPNRPTIPINNPLSENFGNPFFDDYFFTPSTAPKTTPTSGTDVGSRFGFFKNSYGKPRDITQVDDTAQTIWSRVFSRGKSSSVTTKEINDFLKQEFSGIERESREGALTFLTSNRMPRGNISADDYTSRSVPRAINFLGEQISSFGGRYWEAARLMEMAPSTVFSQDPGQGFYISNAQGRVLRHETGHAISASIANAIDVEENEELDRIRRGSVNTTGNLNPRVNISPEEINSTARANVMKRMRASMSQTGRTRGSQLLAEAIESNAGTHGGSSFGIRNFTGDLTSDMRRFGSLSTMSENEIKLVHNLMQSGQQTALGGTSYGPQKFSSFMYHVVEEAFADDIAFLTSPKLNLDDEIVSGFFQETRQGVSFVEKPPVFKDTASVADYLSRTITHEFYSGYAAPSGDSWSNYMQRVLGEVMDEDQRRLLTEAKVDWMDEASGLSLDERNAVKKFANEIYVGSRTGGIVSIAPIEGGIRNTRFHIPGLKDTLGAQGYSESEVTSIVDALRDRIEKQQDMFYKGETNQFGELIDEVAPTRLDLRQPVAKIASGVNTPAVQIRQTVSESVAKRKVGNSTAGRQFFSSAVQSAKGSKVASSAGRVIRSVFT